jgi:type I restriction enzyme S subunit
MSNWQEAILSEHIGLRHGYQFRETDFTENGIQVIKIGNVTSDGLSLDANVSYVSNLRVNEFESIIIKDGDILMSLTGNIGRVVEVNNLGNKILFQNYRVGVFYPLKDNISKPFIKWVLSSEEILRQLNSNSNQSAQANFGKQDLDKLKFKIPSTPEQNKISNILNTTELVIEKTQAAIAKYKAIKQGMLNDLFTRGIDIKTGKLRPKQEDAPDLYKETELGWIPNEWDINRLEEVTDYVDYRGKTPPKSEFGIYLVTARNIKEGYIDYEISKEYIREDAFESAMSRGKVKLGDVLITTEAPMGNIAQIDRDDIALAQRVIKYRGYDSILNNNYLANYLMSDGFQRLLFSEATGSTVLGIKGSRLHKLKIAVPEIDEQILIAERIKNNTKILDSEQNYLLKLQQIKSGLMADLLSGNKLVSIPKEIETQIN